MASIEEKVENLISENITELGYILYDVQYLKEGSDYYLKIFIEKPETEDGISIEDCEKVTHEINDMLDSADYIKEQYFLEVSSTGIEKVIRKDKHLQQNIGQKIYVKLYKTVNNTKEIIGVLQDYDRDKIVIKTQTDEIIVERKDVSIIKKFFDWENMGGNE